MYIYVFVDTSSWLCTYTCVYVHKMLFLAATRPCILFPPPLRQPLKNDAWKKRKQQNMMSEDGSSSW